MKQIQIILLVLFCAFTGFNVAGQTNANLQLLTLNSGQVNQGAVVDLQVSVGNTGTNDIGVNKVRAQISIPIAIATALPTVQQTGLPAGWIILTNTGGAITVCNGTDIIPGGQQRQIFIKIQGTALGGPSTINGSLSFGPGSGVCTGPGSLPGDNTADNTSTSSITVVAGPACSIAVSASAGSIACNGGTTTLTATATGAAGAVEYSINGGTYQSANTFTVNAAGSPYTVTAREVSNTSCSATSNAVTVTEPTAITASATAGSIACNGGTTSLTVTASGGTGSLQYSLNGGTYQAGNTFTVNAAGSPYTVTVKDANNCTVTTSSVTVNQPTAITASAAAGTVACNGGTTTLTVTASGGTAPLQYSLNGGTYQAGNTFTVNAAGSPYTVTVKDANNCTATTSSVTVNQPTAITASAAAGTIACNGATTTLTVTASGGTAPLQYSLNGGSYQAGNTFTVNAAGSPYTVTVKDANNCTATTSSITVNQPTQLTATATSTAVTSIGGSDGTATAVPVGGTSPYTYSWAPGGQATITATGLAAGSYTVTVTDFRGCTTTAGTTVGSPSCSVTASAVAGTAIQCNGGTTSLTVTVTGATAPVQYSLDGGTTFQLSNVFTVVAGTYTVTVKDANNCTATTSAVTITQPTAVVVGATAQPIALPGGTTTVTITATGGTGPYTGTGSFVRSAGTYTFTVTDSRGCTGSTQLTLSDPVAGNANATLNILTLNSGQVNQGAVVDLQVSVGNTGPSFIGVNKVRAQISIPIAIATALPNAQQTGLPAGWIILTNTGGSITICNGTDQIPSGQQRQLFIKVQGTAAGGPSTINGSLSFGPGTGVCTGPGSLPGDNTADNTSTSSITVNSTCSLGVTATAGTIACNGGTTTLTATATGAAGAVEYSLNGGAFQSGNTFTVNAAGSPYTVTAREVATPACTATATPVTVTQPALLVASSVTGIISCNGGTATIVVSATGGTAPYTGTGSFNAAAGAYSYTVTDANGCTAVTTGTLTQPAVITVTATNTAITCFGGSSTVTVSATGGTAPYTGTGTFTQLAGTTVYTVTDARGCTGIISKEITQPTLLVASSTSTIAACGGTGTVTVTATGGTAPYTGTGTFTAPAGAYSYTVTDANGCTSTTTGSVASDCQGALAATVVKTNLSACRVANDGTITVTATGGTAPYTYSWTGLTGSNQTAFTAGNVSSLTGLNYGYYNVTVTDAASNSVTISNIHVEFAFTVYVTASGSNTSSCGNTGSILLYGNAGVQPYTYSIDGITYQASNLFSNLAAGTFTGYIKDAAGCIGTKPGIVVSAATGITASTFTRAAANCLNDGSLEVYRTGGIPPFTYSINGTTFQVSNVFNNLAAGTYTATVKDSKGCIGTATGIVAQGTAVTVTTSKNNSSNCISDGTIQVNATGGIAPYTYSINGGSFQSSNTFSLLGAGSYTVTVKDTKGCTGTATVTISTNPIVVTSNVVNASNCTASNGSIQLFRTGGFAPFLYSIDGNTYQASPVFSNLSHNTYTGYVKDSRGCVGMLTDIMVGPAGCPPSFAATTKSNGSASGKALQISHTLKIQAYPNPSVNDFTVALEGFDSKEPIAIIVTDVLGRIVYKTAGVPKQRYEFGNNFIAGIYNVQVVQGNESKSLKLVKE